MYTIIDIETTGGKFNEEGITEIAIYKHDGKQVVDTFISLINPEKDIQPFVVNLTGINNKMVAKAPKFHEVAKRIVEITENTIFIAHNVSFDYRIIQNAFRNLGFEYHRETLCTVQLAKKLIPNLPSYSLGKLCKSVGIPLANRHRAEGDTQATTKLFELLLFKDIEKEIISKTIKPVKKHTFSKRHENILEDLPEKIGVFYLHNKNGKILYVDKAKNIKIGFTNLLLREAKKIKYLLKLTHSVTYELAGNELMCRLRLEQERIKNKPRFNSRKRIKEDQSLVYDQPNFIIVDKGRHIGENSVILIENNVYIGNAYIDLQMQIQNKEVLHNLITINKEKVNAKPIIVNYLKNNKVKQIISF